MANYYNPYPYSYYNPMQQQMQLPIQQLSQQPQQIQNGGFISVRNELEARNYPVAPGNSVTFKDETAPYVYTKTMGFSQLDRPIFDKYKLVKEDAAEVHEEKISNIEECQLENMKIEIKKLWDEVNAIKNTQIKPVEQNKNGGGD